MAKKQRLFASASRSKKSGKPKEFQPGYSGIRSKPERIRSGGSGFDCFFPRDAWIDEARSPKDSSGGFLADWPSRAHLGPAGIPADLRASSRRARISRAHWISSLSLWQKMREWFRAKNPFS
jgi:hypothetical protein